LVHDATSGCPYLEDTTARLPLRLPIRALRRREFETRLAQGDRRQGLLLYRTACPDCQACEPIRLAVDTFEPGRTQRRTFRKTSAVVEATVGPLAPTQEKVDLYNRHKHGRDLAVGESELDLDGYRAFLGESCCDTFEVRYSHRGRLVGVAITDRSDSALSAVYCYFDPDLPELGLGTFSILTQVELARRWGLEHVYLGLYIRDCASMAYKARFLPHQRLKQGRWQTFDRG
jgi:arginyl-tRNA--protein-N-Asp/Glu arginylyltransferase